jgi:formylglycine-generating enzyme required for sulfatase activity
VGSYDSNKLGLHDMHGNVLQWCGGSGLFGSDCVIRGSCFDDIGARCRAGIQFTHPPSHLSLYLGFRIVRVNAANTPVLPSANNKKNPVNVAATSALVREMNFVPVAKGTFWMGWDSENKHSKEVLLEQDFEIAAYTVTQGQWEVLIGSNPSFFSRQEEFSRQSKFQDSVKNVSDA